MYTGVRVRVSQQDWVETSENQLTERRKKSTTSLRIEQISPTDSVITWEYSTTDGGGDIKMML